jgi:hypothetical protein
MEYNSLFTENDLQRLFEEMLRPPQAGIPMNPNFTIPNYREPRNNNVRNPPNNDIITALRDIIVMYNSNISEYNNNISTSLQLIRFLLEERNNLRPMNRNPANMVPGSSTLHPPVENIDPSNNTPPLTTNRNNDPLFSYVLYRPTIRSEDAGALRRFFQNIVVQPTIDQINDATTLIPFHANEENVNNTCPITMEEFQEGEIVRQIRHCRHQFQEEPIQNWFRSNVRCPVCRYDIRDYVIPTGSRSDTTTEPSQEELPGYNELLQEITQNFATDINNIISENFQATLDGAIPDISQNFVFDFHVEANL